MNLLSHFVFFLTFWTNEELKCGEVQQITDEDYARMSVQ